MRFCSAIEEDSCESIATVSFCSERAYCCLPDC